MPTPQLPDSVALGRQALLAQPSFSLLVGGRVHDQIPAAPVWPLAVLTAVTDGELEWHTGRARLQVDIWGAGPSSTDKQQVRQIAAELVAVSRDLRGSYPSGHLSNSAVLSASPLPDPVTGRQRQIVDLLLESNP